jgi:hypothetical protein
MDIDLSKLNSPDDAPKDGTEFISWAIDAHGEGYEKPSRDARWVTAQWANDCGVGNPYWRWSVPGRSTRVIILGWLPLPWNDRYADCAAGRNIPI